MSNNSDCSYQKRNQRHSSNPMMTRICYAITILRSLCAKIDGKVEFIEPPKDAKIGDRLVPESYSGGSKPFVPNQVKRKKVSGVLFFFKLDFSRLIPCCRKIS